MNPERLRARVAANGRVGVRLDTAQRDLIVRSPATPRGLAHALRDAPVREGKLALRVRRAELDAMIEAAAGATAPTRAEERELAALLRYLEDLADRFREPEADEDLQQAGMPEE